MLFFLSLRFQRAVERNSSALCWDRKRLSAQPKSVEQFCCVDLSVDPTVSFPSARNTLFHFFTDTSIYLRYSKDRKCHQNLYRKYSFLLE